MQNIRESSKENMSEAELAVIIDRQRGELERQQAAQTELLDARSLFRGILDLEIAWELGVLEIRSD